MTEADEILRMERIIPAPPERVFAAWTDAEILARWFGPEGCSVPSASFDPRVGGAWRLEVLTPSGATRVAEGVYRAFEPPTRLLTSWAWRQDDGALGHETELELRFQAVETGTRLLLTHRNFAERAHRDSHQHGWTGSLDRLALLFAAEKETDQ